MAVRGADVVKSLMKMGVMATVNQVVDADTAEVVVGEFGHTVKRVSDSDVKSVSKVWTTKKAICSRERLSSR